MEDHEETSSARSHPKVPKQGNWYSTKDGDQVLPNTENIMRSRWKSTHRWRSGSRQAGDSPGTAVAGTSCPQAELRWPWGWAETQVRQSESLKLINALRTLKHFTG